MHFTSTTKVVCNTTIETLNGKLQTFTCFNDAVQSFLASIHNDTNVDAISDEELQKRMLHSGKMKMIVDSRDKLHHEHMHAVT